jgi:hypothetical protein
VIVFPRLGSVGETYKYKMGGLEWLKMYDIVVEGVRQFHTVVHVTVLYLKTLASDM